MSLVNRHQVTEIMAIYELALGIKFTIGILLLEVYDLTTAPILSIRESRMKE